MSENVITSSIDIYPGIFPSMTHEEYKFQTMITFTHCSLIRDSCDVTIKHVHSEKHSDVNRRVIAVFEVVVFGIWCRDCLKLYAVL